jgi:hypothetical protein
MTLYTLLLILDYDHFRKGEGRVRGMRGNLWCKYYLSNY